MFKRGLLVVMTLITVIGTTPASAQAKTFRFGTVTGAFIDDVNALLIKNFNKLLPMIHQFMHPNRNHGKQMMDGQKHIKQNKISYHQMQLNLQKNLKDI